MDSKFKTFVIIAIVFLGVAIAGSTFLIWNMIGKNKVVATSTEKEKESDKNSDPLLLGDAVVTNVLDEQGEVHILRAVVAFNIDASEKEHKEFSEKFEAKKMAIKNEIIYIIRQQTFEMMIRGDAQIKLGDEITNRINKILETDKIKSVDFGDFFVQ